MQIAEISFQKGFQVLEMSIGEKAADLIKAAAKVLVTTHPESRY